jgi:hypothetical protein
VEELLGNQVDQLRMEKLNMTEQLDLFKQSKEALTSQLLNVQQEQKGIYQGTRV